MENQILELEKTYWKAMETHDFDTVKNLTRFPCIVAGKDGYGPQDQKSSGKCACTSTWVKAHGNYI